MQTHQPLAGHPGCGLPDSGPADGKLTDGKLLDVGLAEAGLAESGAHEDDLRTERCAGDGQHSRLLPGLLPGGSFLPAGDLVVVDVETTGWLADAAGITEIGAVRLSPGRPAAEFSALVNPGRPIPAHISELTGITDAMVSEAPAIAEVLPAFLVCQDELLALLSEARGLALDRIKISSPFQEKMRYSVWSNFVVGAAHHRRHLWQAERVADAISAS